MDWCPQTNSCQPWQFLKGKSGKNIRESWRQESVFYIILHWVQTNWFSLEMFSDLHDLPAGFFRRLLRVMGDYHSLITYLFFKRKWKSSRSVVSDSVTPWTVAYQAPLSMGFSRQECWSGVSLPSPGDLPDPGLKSGSPTLQAEALPSEPPGKPIYSLTTYLFMLNIFV